MPGLIVALCTLMSNWGLSRCCFQCEKTDRNLLKGIVIFGFMWYNDYATNKCNVPKILNTWGDSMEIKRDLYLNKLINRKHNGLIKVITGIRRCGKSYLLFNLFNRHLLSSGVPEDHIIKIAFDMRKTAELRDPDKLCEYVESKMTDMLV